MVFAVRATGSGANITGGTVSMADSSEHQAAIFCGYVATLINATAISEPLCSTERVAVTICALERGNMRKKYLYNGTATEIQKYQIADFRRLLIVGFGEYVGR